MTSETYLDEVFVWIWLPGGTTPVVAGRLATSAAGLVFNYGRSYLERRDAIPIYAPELPLRPGVLPLARGLEMPSCLRDAGPDAWGRRVILHRRFGRRGADLDTGELDELRYLLESGSDRTGALDFQASPNRYVARDSPRATLEALMGAADAVEKGTPIEPSIEQALFNGSAIGGARPKVTLEDGDRKLIAKFSSQSDVTNVVKAEFVAMRLAALSGLDVAHVDLVRAADKDVLLVERFDRERVADGWTRQAMVSALTLLGGNEATAPYQGYEELAHIVRRRFATPRNTLEQLFKRIVFNVLSGNTDDHARNHAAFWDGERLSLTPAFDVCPQPRRTREATQMMQIVGGDRRSRLSICLKAANLFLLDEDHAVALIEDMVRQIRNHWPNVCQEAVLTTIDRNTLWQQTFLNESIFEDAPTSLRSLLDDAYAESSAEPRPI